ncbi:MAG: PAS domain S-box-containing protein [Lysobacterales bacterium]|jgi:PAS domain S-box-containing protein
MKKKYHILFEKQIRSKLPAEFLGKLDDFLEEVNSTYMNYEEQKIVLNQIIATIPHKVFWKDHNSVYLGCNKNFAKVAGLNDVEEIVGKTDYDLAWKKEESDFFRKIDREIMDSGEPKLDIEETQLQADGSKAFLITSKVPVRNKENEVTGILGVFTEITHIKCAENKLRDTVHALEEANDEKKGAMEELASNEIFYTQTLNAISDMILVKSSGSKIYWANKAFCDYYGMSLKQLKNIVDSPHNNSEYTKKYVEDDKDVFDKGVSINIDEEPVTRHDGEIRYFHTVKSPVYDKSGKIINSMGVSRDMTEHKIFEDKLKETLANLQDFKSVTVGREIQMIELKKEINELCEKFGQKPRYKII